MNRRRASILTTKTPGAKRTGLSHPITGRQVSHVEIERADRLHRKFLSADKALAAGRPLRQVFRGYAEFWSDRVYRSDPARRVRFSFATLVNRYYQWVKAGRNKESLYRRWLGLYPSIPADLLCRFVEFSCRHQFPNMKAAWRGFTKGRTVKANYQQLVYYITGKKFAKLQSAQRAIARAETHLENLRFEYTSEIRARVPARPRRRTRQELSQGSAAL